MNNNNYIQETETVQQIQKYYSYIYEIKHLPTGKLYVGSRCAQSVLKKFEDCYTDKYMGSSKLKEGPFSKVDIKKNRQDYQKTVLKVFYSEDVNAAHRQEHGENGLIATYLQQYGDNICLNQHYYKNCGTKVWSTAGLSGEKNPFFGKTHTEEAVKKIREANKLARENRTEIEKEEISRKLSEASKNMWENRTETEKEEHGRKISEAYQNKTDVKKEEHSRKLSEASKNMWKNKAEEEKEEHRKNCSEASKLAWENKTKQEKEEINHKKSETRKNKSETEKEEISRKLSESGKIANNIKYKCPYDDYVNIAAWVGIYIRKNHSDKKQWKDYTKEEKEQFKI